jgi:hypothetical protein
MPNRIFGGKIILGASRHKNIGAPTLPQRPYEVGAEETSPTRHEDPFILQRTQSEDPYLSIW